jgi:hypothetical protein
MVEFELPHGSVGMDVVDLVTGELAESVTIPAVPQPAGGIKDPSFMHGPTMVINVTIPALSYKAFSTTASTSQTTAVWSCGMVGSRAFSQDTKMVRNI